MLKAVGHFDGKVTLILGLSFSNLDKFRAEPNNTFIRIKGEEMGLPINIILFSGETEAYMHKYIEPFINSNTKAYIDPKLKG